MTFAYRAWRIRVNQAQGLVTLNTRIDTVLMAATIGSSTNLCTDVAACFADASIHPPAGAIDGVTPATYWESNIFFPKSWGYDFGGSVDIRYLTLSCLAPAEGPYHWWLEATVDNPRLGTGAPDPAARWITQQSFVSANWSTNPTQSFIVRRVAPPVVSKMTVIAAAPPRSAAKVTALAIAPSRSVSKLTAYAVLGDVPPLPPPEVTLALLNSPELQFMDADGHPYAGGTVDLFVPNSTTPKDSWIDPSGDTLNERPIRLDSAGRCIVWGDGLYRVVLRDADGNLIFDQPSSTLVSAAMVPVVSAPTLADARAAMGIDAAIQVETDRAVAAEGLIADDLADEITTRTTNVEDIQTALTAEADERIAQDAALQDQIDALAPIVVNVQGGLAAPDASGHGRITFPVPFATTCDGVGITMANAGFGSNTNNVANLDRFGFDVWITQAGSPIPKPSQPFYWMAVGT